MSFLVVSQGQFSPYVYHVRPARQLRAAPVAAIPVLASDTGSFENELRQVDPAGPWQPGARKSVVGAYEVQRKNFEEHRDKTYARDIMSSPLFFVSPQDRVVVATDLMGRMGYRHLPVVEDGKLVGILSDRELISTSAAQNIGGIMKPQVIVALESTRIQEIAHLMLAERINALPIVNYKHDLVGIVTLSDILKFVIQLEA